MFPALRAFNGSHNAFRGPLPAAFGESGIFTLAPLQFADGETMAHVFDLSFNQLTGKLPSYLYQANVPGYVQRGILLQVRAFLHANGPQAPARFWVVSVWQTSTYCARQTRGQGLPLHWCKLLQTRL